MKLFKGHKRVWQTVGIVTVLLLLITFYNHWLSRTKIAFVNFQPVTLQAFSQANDNPMIKLYEVNTDELDNLDDYDVVLITGMGLQITAEQRGQIQEAANSGVPVYTLMATNPDNNISNFTIDETVLLSKFMMSESKKNCRSMLNYLRRNIDGKLICTGDIALPEQKPDDYLYYPMADAETGEDEHEFLSVGDYEKFMKQQGLWFEGNKKIMVTGLITDPTELIKSLVARKYNVYPVSSFLHLLDFAKEIRPNAIINMAHGRLGDEMVQFLTEQNIPLFDPLNVNMEVEQWQQDPMGMVGGFMSQSVVMPEIDGAIRTTAVFGLRKDDDGLLHPYAIPDRLEKFVKTVDHVMALQTKMNGEKRLAIVYFKGPGQSNLTASGMDVAQSLYNTLVNLRSQGYNVSGLPATAAEFRRKVMQMVNDPASFPHIEYGNIALLPQPLAGEGKDVFKIIHGTGQKPPQNYIDTYLWIQNDFKADALLHFGTHGSLEYTPQKQVALDSNDWPDRLVGSLPHFYYYTIDNVGEAMIAKRRTYATLLSYLTPAFHESHLRQTYQKLQDNIFAYQNNKGDKQQLAQTIKMLTEQLGLNKDLGIESKSYSEADIERIGNYAEELASEKITDTPYIMGVPYTQEDIRSTVFSMTVDPIAYSLYTLDKQQGKAPQGLESQRAKFNAIYLKRAESLVEGLYGSGQPLSVEQLSKITGISTNDIARVDSITEAQNAPKGMMAMMMAASRKSGNKASHGMGMMGDAKNDTTTIPEPKRSPIAKIMQWNMRKMMAKKDPSTMLDVARKMGASEEALKKMEEGLKKQMGINSDSTKGKTAQMTRQTTSRQDIELAHAVNEVRTALNNIARYRQYLMDSPQEELQALVNGLNGGYTAPSPGGDLIVNPNTLPTGRNLFAINAEETPTADAWEKGVALAKATIANYQKKHNGEYPRKVSYTLWSGEFIQTGGATIAQVLYMLGVEPVRDRHGRVSDLTLIPSETLGRPRIDVVVQTSGQLRDLAASRLFLINRAVRMAAEATDDQYNNQVKAGVEESERYLIDKGVSPKQAREMSQYRVFGGAGGGYGSGIQSMVEQGNAWDNDQQIAEVYMNNMGAFYGDQEHWMSDMHEAFSAALTRTDVVVQPRQNNTWGALSLDHVYEFMGGMNMAVRQVTGKDPDAVFSDYRNRNNYRMQDSKEAIGVEARTKLFNPSYIKNALKGGDLHTDEIAEMVRNTYGWNVMKPKNIDKEMWNEVYEVYVKDKYQLGIQQQFAMVNPGALQEMTATMMETARKGYWKATPQQLADIAALHTDLVDRFGPTGTAFEGNNPKLQAFIAQQAPKAQGKAYQQRMSQNHSDAKGMVMEKQTTQLGDAEEKGSATSSILVVGIVLVLFVVLVIVMRRKRK